MQARDRVFFGMLVFFCFFCAFSEAAVPVMPVSELRAGMVGTGKTVVQGTKIEDFSVEILGVLKKQGPVENLILVRVSGPLIDKTGGIAQGMSGSPVMIDGRLVGAVAYGWGFSDARLGLLTPAEDMVKLWDLPHGFLPKSPIVDISDWQNVITPYESEEARWGEIFKAPLPEIRQMKEKAEPSSEGDNKKSSSGDTQLPEVSLPEGGIRPLATPLLVSGMTPRAMDFLRKKLEPLNLIPYETGSGSSNTSGTLAPGSPIGAQFVKGDVNMGALGTVTWVEDGKVIAFGHPFIHGGESSYFMTSAEVIGVIPSVNSAFKLGTLGNTLGMIDQDRQAGISGQLRLFPKTTQVKLTVIDMSGKVEKSLKFDVVQHEKLTSALVPASIYSGIDQVMAREAGGTAFVQMTLKGKNLPNGQVTRSAMLYGSKNLAEVSINELDFALGLLNVNPFEKVELDEIEVKINLTEEKKLAQIIRAASPIKEAYPGETIEVEVEMQPYREKRVIEKIKYTIPPYATPGNWFVLVRGGASYLTGDEMPKEVVSQIVYLEKERWLAPKDLKDLVNTYLGLNHSQDLILEGYFVPTEKDKEKLRKAQDNRQATGLTPLEEKSMGSTDDIQMYESSFKLRKIKPWIIYGDSYVEVKVKKPKASSAPKK